MKTLQHLNELPQHLKVGLTIGNFDGVHLGHQHFLQWAMHDCHEKELKFVVVTFVPHPALILDNGRSLLLNTYEERKHLLERLGVDYLIELPFTRDLSTCSPETFLQDHIVGPWLHTMYLGHDFAFGSNKRGNHQFVEDYFDKTQTSVLIHSQYCKDDHAISSSTVRSSLLQGDISKVNDLLGRPFFISGRVVKGAGRGRTLGYPTANLQFAPLMIIPKKGVYLTRVFTGGRYLFAATNVGHNPTFTNEQKINIESHLFDVDLDLYGEKIEVHFLEFLRDERPFENRNELILQIEKDESHARKLIKHHANS